MAQRDISAAVYLHTEVGVDVGVYTRVRKAKEQVSCEYIICNNCE